ncbi:hypothetical protein OVA03_16350 [Asticcacaulis sp. SL142]|uniref:hypothetical protein n=1 Tax=Asticcacaulis sp. SL142 TaxID=2995155 RepID=UPI00226D28FB|nr:hypothetical protein [Asticcacaulis sp. SL142]WAC48240.1 hypothetical protein OVA03_16350 [Asticcacaulis sp. SL142]
MVVRVRADKLYILSVQRKSEPRVFEKMDTLVGYLKKLGIEKFDVDTAAYAPVSYTRPDRSTALKEAHEAAAHDKWFQKEVAKGLKAADSPDAIWISHEDVKASMIAKLLARVDAAGANT